MTPLNVTSATGQAQGSDAILLFRIVSLRSLLPGLPACGYDSDPDANHNRSGTIEKQRLLFMGTRGGSAAAPSSSIKARTQTKGSVKGKYPGLEVLTLKGLVNDEEVAEAVSPGRHITKRRARSPPVSAELLESVHGTPVASQDKPLQGQPGLSHESYPQPAAKFKFSDTVLWTYYRHQHCQFHTSNRPVSPLFLRTDPHPSQRPQFPNRHSYAGSGSPSQWASRSPPAAASSPAPINARKRMESDCSEDEADLFFSSGPADSSFAISLQRGCTPSLKKKQKRESLNPLPKKFRPRDSGVVLTDSDDHHTNFVMAAMPRASTSVSTVASSFDEGFRLFLRPPATLPDFDVPSFPTNRLDRHETSDTASRASGLDAYEVTSALY
ncbi:hypothetical protein LXA43DRAFT_1128570 [Ganoderma leucocontextum]|nr:hypothetical protein LXA43DRAFT_1128570 [Ganoderma leucocontextum]